MTVIALVGSGEYLPPIEPLDIHLLGLLPAEPSVACLPTAAGAEGEARVHYWSELGVKHYTRLGVKVQAVPVVDAPSANDPILAAQVRQANFIYLSGGNPDYLYKSLRDSLVWQAIQQVLAGGGLLAGCSAGAMVLGERIPAFPTWRRTFNLLSGAVVVPHFDELPSHFHTLMKAFVGRGSTLVGIEANSALIQTGAGRMAAGTGGVTVWNQFTKKRFTDGQEIPTELFPMPLVKQ